MGCHFLLQEIFPTQVLNLGLLHYRQILYSLSHQGSLMLSIICVKMLKKLNDIQQFAYNAEDRGSILGLGGSLGEENGNPLWYSCLENSTEKLVELQPMGSQRVGHD